MPRLAIHNGIHKGQELELQRGKNLLGRAEPNDFVLEELTVSSHHCELWVGDFAIKVKDLGSTNGTYVDGRPVKEAELKDGSVLKLGDVEMRLVVEPVAIAVPELPAVPPPPPTSLGDGQAACFNHPEELAMRKCVQCGRTFCDACVKELRLVGKRSRYFCPMCSGSCQIIGPTVAPVPKSFASRLLDTIRLPWRRGAPKE